MKKFLSTMLALALCIPLAACGTGAGNHNGGSGDDNKDHSHNFTWTGNDTEHWMACSGCTETKDRGVHIDANADAVCDICERPVIIHPDDGHGGPEEGEDDDNEDVQDPVDHPAAEGQDAKNYFLVGTLGAFGMNWQQEYWEDLKFARAEDTDENGLTVFTKIVDFREGDKFKVVNDKNASVPEVNSDSLLYYEGSFDYSFVRGGNAATNFVASTGSGRSIVLLAGHAGKYKVTLHTHPEDGTQSFLTIDFVGQSEGTPHTHSFSEEWSTDPAFHWHAATCGHTMSKDKAKHDFSDGLCTVCGYGNPPKEDDPVEGGGDEGGDIGDVGDFEFGDDISYQNKAFYNDYTEEDKELYYTLWKETTSVGIKVDITPEELYKLNDQARGSLEVQETYRKCNLTITVNGKDYYYDEVGIRMRGNTSRTEFCDQNGNIYNFVHFRFSLSETFDGDEYSAGSWGEGLYHDWSNDPEGRAKRKDRAFATMEKFYYKWNKNYDQTYIREVYTNRMFQAYGILAPHITLTQLSVMQNGSMESLGVGNLYETIDKAFIKRNFDKANKGGDLYKCSYLGMGPADLRSIDGAGLYDGCTYELKTNDDPEDFNNHKYLKAFVDMLASDDATFMQKLESMIDMDYFARFEAVNYLVGNPDCIRNNANNYYLYFTPAGKAYLIPYDYDRCFGINMDWNPWDGMVRADPYTVDTPNGGCNNPLYTRTILEGGIKKYQTMYQGWLKKILEGDWFTYANFKPIYENYKKTYSGLTQPSNKLRLERVDTSRFYFSENGTKDYGSTWENISMQDYLTEKRKTALARIDKI